LLLEHGMTNLSSGRRVLRACAAGYSAVEMMMAMGIFGVLSAMAVVQIGQARPGLKGDGAMRVAMAQMTSARELAITQRRFMRLNFDTANSRVQIIREEVPGPALTVLASVPFEGGIVFTLVAGQPDTPDAFGRAAAVDFGTATEVKFAPDGTLVNQAGANLNGSIFLAMPGMKLSSRAVTVLGSTGRIRGYKWDGAHWVLV
jgi:prepilin-type N-terminal cleavage/methylation domain-containing protein